MTDGKSPPLAQKAKERLSAVADTLTGQPHFTFPTFDQLPKVEGQPQGCAWGLFDKNGVKDQVGTLNLLTPDVVRQASSEIRTGQHVQLDWCLSDNVEFPGFGRRKFEQKVIDTRAATKGAIAGFDDEVYMNTQSGSQWDSLKHFAHQKTQMYYNGLSHDEALKSDTNGIHNICERGGIVGRGVLIDWLSWYEKVHGKPPSPVSRHEIPVSELEDCLRSQGTSTRPGDILLVRTGYTRWHNYANPEERKRGTKDSALAIGLQNNETTVRWLYDHHFAAVASDTIAFEAWPPPFKKGWVLHEWLLVQWGTPIGQCGRVMFSPCKNLLNIIAGELWNLEELSRLCEQQKKYTFFITSAPLHVRGGIGSPPGAIAIL
ncbi:hypothetical protein CLAFUW4_04997 [Fulvia fulva]|uniref:Cyclase n=1 Tax=Passalora fulva TaxID=5499 RepID=A0A9Q8PHZ6_PASFU|nr:uncharacterized protein CLAFUR5_11910 [Fulvia fulva]KAK4626333.1 hypothetical protein CLAFUR4_04983 [Fulvia fulva]KAK4627759.1 hypothetical protein CLAFUR0_04987 [Fulvia fulva]UJO22772.1 hypothetical protein CLAFUR5_11910 [Fulvia fulva]WPV13292.1 hypothetical protein CLAFUW4_04997 [Fulvia fulva]WPV28727.1 hypothetical protein CLAFUW7_04991 [Fulvia fulva]